jgi:hypothetical protein
MNRGGQCAAGLRRFVVGYGNVLEHLSTLSVQRLTRRSLFPNT